MQRAQAVAIGCGVTPILLMGGAVPLVGAALLFRTGYRPQSCAQS